MSRPDDLAIIDAALRGEDDGSELAMLVADVRASAPRMSPALERRLEAVVRERPAAAAARRRRWLLAPAGGLAVVAAGVIAAVVVSSKNESVTTFSRAGGAQT